jgi:hypothetical protein
MRIFFQNIHRRLVNSFAKALQKSNSTLLLPDDSFSNVIAYGEKVSQKEIDDDVYMSMCNNIKSISYDEFLLNPPEIIIISCYEVEKDVIQNLWNRIDISNCKLVYYNGNNDFYCDWDYANNIVTTDILTAQKAKFRNKNVIFWLPWIDYEQEFCFDSINNSNIFNSYITKYKIHFPNDYLISEELQKDLAKIDIQFNIYDGIKFNDIADKMKNSCGTIHIKSLEGYGYSIIESIATGRMVFLYKPYSINKTYLNWCIEDKTCFYFSTQEELFSKIKNYREKVDYYQPNAAKNIRELINNDRQTKRLNDFLINLP